MFGAIVFIPLFLQLVYGASPTASGLRMLPLMIGLLVAAVASGRIISHIGRYRLFPITGTAVLVTGMFLLSRLGVGTAPWLASIYMLIVGVGIGLTMQVLVLVVQNDAKPENMGVATSTATFFRSVGGSFGVAIFGAIFASRLTDKLEALPPSVRERIGSGVHLNPAEIRTPAPEGARVLPERVLRLPPRRLPVGDGDRGDPVRALVASSGDPAQVDARPSRRTNGGANRLRLRSASGRGRRPAPSGSSSERQGSRCRATCRRMRPRS